MGDVRRHGQSGETSGMFHDVVGIVIVSSEHPTCLPHLCLLDPKLKIKLTVHRHAIKTGWCIPSELLMYAVAWQHVIVKLPLHEKYIELKSLDWLVNASTCKITSALQMSI